MKIYRKEDIYGGNDTGNAKKGILQKMILDVIMSIGAACDMDYLKRELYKRGIYPYRYRNENAFHNTLLMVINRMIKIGILDKYKQKGKLGFYYGLPEDFGKGI